MLAPDERVARAQPGDPLHEGLTVLGASAHLPHDRHRGRTAGWSDWGASFGALVWVFQDGHLGGLIGTEALGSLRITTPVLVFAIAFRLSMDYEVFLLGRIAEPYRATGDTDRAVERALQRTGRIVTAAALLVIAVFAGFVAGGFSPVKQVGLGLALAVAVAATLVRMLLLPAVKTLMGRWNWWAPSHLHRLSQRLQLREDPTEHPATAPSSTPTAVVPAQRSTAHRAGPTWSVRNRSDPEESPFRPQHRVEWPAK